MKVNNPNDIKFPYKAKDKEEYDLVLYKLNRLGYIPHPKLKSLDDNVYPITISCLDKDKKYYIIY